MELNVKLQMLRKQKGMTQEELADVLYVSRAAVSKWESGRGYPNIDSLKAIAEFFSVSIDELLSGEELSGTPTPVGGVMHRLAAAGAKILLVGVGNDKNTFLHSVDEELDIPDRMERESYPLTVLDADGNCHITQFRSHHCSRSKDVSKNYPNYEKALVDTGAQTFGVLGNATVRIVDAAACRETVIRILKNADRDVAVEPMEIPEAWYQ